MSSPSPHAGVAVVLVTHDGARWLPGVLAGLAEQDAVARVVAVDTGSLDASRDLVRGAFPDADLLELTSAVSFPGAVDAALAHLDALPPEQRPEWVWLLHDDARPAPGALAALLEAASDRPDVDVLGPKLREWPSLRRLLELGVTISGTGRRETGLETGEYDQGQHDERREVLAVNSAGMLARREVLAGLGGFDERLPMFGNDVDLGWRAAAAGHTTLVVPEAVVFHAEAAHRGLRRTALTGRHTHFQERRAALYTLLVNSRTAALPWRVLRLTLGTLVRMLGFVLLRSVGEALDDLAALVAVVGRPGAVRAGRRARREQARRLGSAPDTARVKALLPPPWVPYRHGLDFLADVTSAASQQAADIGERRRIAAAEADPSSLAAARLRAEQARRERDDDEEGELADTGAFARFVTNPVALALTAVVVVLLVGAGAAWGSVSGGALSPVPEGAGDWWSLHLDAWHELAGGTDVPAPPYVLPLALLASVVGTTAAVSALLVLSAPFALWGAFRFLRVTGRLVSTRGAPRVLLVGGATAYAVVPVVSGAWGNGRLGVVVAAALLPWLAHATLGFADPEPDRRRRAGWRVGLLLALVASFTPLVWVLAAVVVVLGLLVTLLLARSALASRTAWSPPLVALLVPVVVLLPWWLPALRAGAGDALLLEAGRVPAESLTSSGLLTGRLDVAYGAPDWVGWLLLGLAVVALVPRATRIPVTVCWLVALLAAGLAALLAPLSLTALTTTTPPGLAVLVVVVQGCLLTAAVLGGQGLARSRLNSLTRTVALGLAAVAAAVPVAGLVWAVTGDDALESDPAGVVPAYMEQRVEQSPARGVLVVTGSIADGLAYEVRRGDGVTLGEDEVLALTPEDAATTEAVRDLAARPTRDLVDRLGEDGVQWLLLPAPADGEVAARLDATSGLTQSGSDPGSRAWEVTRPLGDGVAGDGSSLRPVLLGVQGLAVLVALVLALPTLRAPRPPAPDETPDERTGRAS
ncbi:hypothetical protein GCM10023340_31170 [Nocardioides marinquilinus]|uniref:Glycosyltransferase family 2 protein n=1 Tax=Nocardioides marinquilinus TaxID=1210400 RepID=A0ABP9PTC0_9ACTN